MDNDSVDNSRLSSNWDHTKNWKKMRDRQEDIKKKLKSGRKLHNIWKPTEMGSAGKGSRERESTVPKVIYDLNWDLAFGNITKEEHERKVREFYENMGDTDEE